MLPAEYSVLVRQDFSHAWFWLLQQTNYSFKVKLTVSTAKYSSNRKPSFDNLWNYDAMKLHHNPFQIFQGIKNPVGLYTRQKWLGEESTFSDIRCADLSGLAFVWGRTEMLFTGATLFFYR